MDYEIDLNEEEIREAVEKYIGLKFTINNIIDSSKHSQDIRKTYCLNFEDDSEFVLKVTNNSFTTPERINGWQRLSKLYKDNGIYCPQIIDNKEGECFIKIISPKGAVYTAYLEEKKKYKTAWEYVKEHTEEKENKELVTKFDNIEFRGKALETIGIVANASTYLVNWPSPYCLYETFSIEDKTDENYEFAEVFYKLCKEQESCHKEILEEIWSIYTEKKRSFEEEYRQLPKAVFQSDLNISNLLIDENLNFAGLIDFNISGTEVILNYAMCESLYFLELEDLVNLEYVETAKKYDLHFKESMECIKKHYRFTEWEKEAFIKLYNIIAPFRFPNISLFINSIKKGETHYIDSMLKWIYKELTRNDLEL